MRMLSSQLNSNSSNDPTLYTVTRRLKPAPHHQNSNTRTSCAGWQSHTAQPANNTHDTLCRRLVRRRAGGRRRTSRLQRGTHEWVPRQYNAPADGLANAVMDDRQPCRDIVAHEPQAAVTLQEDALRRLWDLARAKRVLSFHRLPYEAIPVWKQVCDLILCHAAFRLSRLATLLLAPVRVRVKG
jgi:hypothetical protein